MNTTDNTYPDGAVAAKKTEVSKDDVKALNAAYVKGATIDDLAVEYGYTPKEVENAVVTPPAPDPEPLTQAAQDDTPTKKGK